MFQSDGPHGSRRTALSVQYDDTTQDEHATRCNHTPQKKFHHLAGIEYSCQQCHYCEFGHHEGEHAWSESGRVEHDGILKLLGGEHVGMLSIASCHRGCRQAYKKVANNLHELKTCPLNKFTIRELTSDIAIRTSSTPEAFKILILVYMRAATNIVVITSRVHMTAMIVGPLSP